MWNLCFVQDWSNTKYHMQYLQHSVVKRWALNVRNNEISCPGVCSSISILKQFPHAGKGMDNEKHAEV